MERQALQFVKNAIDKKLLFTFNPFTNKQQNLFRTVPKQIITFYNLFRVQNDRFKF